MPSTWTERDQIFATLASRTGLASPEALASTILDPPGDGRRTLADVLEDRGQLGADDRTLLEGLVDATLRAHDGDPGRVLAGLDAPSTWASPSPATGAATGSFAKSVGATVASPPEGGGDAWPAGREPGPWADGRFREIRLHARGGLGEVYVAHDGELDREVALKRIQARHADRPDHRARFVVEAEVTGSLEHPGIVPVYSLGRGPDGRPFYAMRLIRGESFEAAIEAFHRADLRDDRDPAGRALALRRMLGRLIDACQAMAYAHSRGVLHRDLKPANIMLGKFGETLIVDWGLARLLDRAEGPVVGGERPLAPHSAGGMEPTEAGSIFGTPSYMSPEQARGEVAGLGPASDVYSLGAILYAVLAGRSPFEGGNALSRLDRARRGEFPSPRAILPGVPPALEAVCLKAMALRAEDRYPSPLGLADDLEHWLADEPVSARREPWPARLARWRRRHSSLVTAAAAVLVAIALALAVGAAAINSERAVAVSERDRARREYARAEEEFRRARRAVDDSFTRISQEVLLDVPGLQPLRRDLIAAAKGYYEEFLVAHGDDPALRSELAETHSRLGEIAETLGEEDEALRSCREAVRLREALARDEPGNPGHRLALALALDLLGSRLIHRKGGLPEARRSIERAIGLLESAAPAGDDSLRVLAGSYANLGALNAQEGHIEASLPLLLRGEAIREELVRKHPKRQDLRMGLARLLADLARGYTLIGPTSEAIRTDERAIEILEGLHRERPEAGSYTFELGATLADLGRFEFNRGRLAASKRHLGRAEELLATLARENPRAIEYRSNLAAVDTMLARLARRDGRLDLAARHVGVARDLFEGLARDHPSVPDYRESLSQSWNVTGRIAAAEARRADALAAFDRAAGLMAGMSRSTATHQYNYACNVALGLPFVAADPARPTEAERAEIEQRAARAVRAVQAAIEGGLTSVEIYLQDEDIDDLRGRDDFRAVLGRLLDRGFPADPFAR